MTRFTPQENQNHQGDGFVGNWDQQAEMIDIHIYITQTQVILFNDIKSIYLSLQGDTHSLGRPNKQTSIVM